MKSSHFILHFIILGIFLLGAFTATETLRENGLLVAKHPTSAQIADGLYYMVAAKAAFLDSVDVYSQDGVRFFLTEFLGSTPREGMQMNLSPIGLIVFLPFLMLTHWNPIEATFLWLNFSLFAFVISIWFQLDPRDTRSNRNTLLWASVAILSEAMFSAVILCQTTLFAISALLILRKLLTQRSEKWGTRFILIPMILALLAMKPQYFLLGASLTLIYRKYMSLFLSGVFASIGLVAYTIFVSPEWLSGYLHILSFYSRGVAPSFYRPGFPDAVMNTLPSALLPFLPKSFSSRLSSALLFLGIALPSILALTRHARLTISPPGSSQDTLALIILGSYLTFSPHSGIYEELFFLLFLTSVPLRGRTLRWFAAFVLICCLNFRAFGIPPQVSWPLKAMLVWGVVVFNWRNTISKQSLESGSMNSLQTR